MLYAKTLVALEKVFLHAMFSFACPSTRYFHAPTPAWFLVSQLVSRSAVADAGRALFDADEKYWQLHTSSRAEVAELEVQSTV